MRSALPIALAGALFLFGPGACNNDPSGLPEPGSVIVAFDDDLARWPADDWDLDTAAVATDSLELSIFYGGGCQTHELWLLAVNGLHELPSAGPTPTASVPMRLAHDAHNDPCDAYIHRTESFDLDPLLDAFRAEYPVGRLLLRVPTGQGGADSVTVEINIQ